MRLMLATLALVLVSLTSCAQRPGQGVTASFAERWGCDHDDVMARAERYGEDLGMSRVWIPRVGWTACELMARRGVPRRVNHQEAGSRRGATWWYGRGSNLTMVSLELSGSTWRVRYVGRE